MPARRINPNRVKLHRSYSVQELAACCDVHRNTVRNWQRQGLEPIDGNRLVLFRGATARAFLFERNARRKRPCPPGTIYCFHCRQPREPALGMVDYLPLRPASGNLRAICGTCETIMHRRVRKADIARIMPGCTIQITEGEPRIIGKARPSPICDHKRKD